MFNFFRRQKNTTEKIVEETAAVVEENKKCEVEEIKKYLCSVNIQLNMDNTIDILCHWPDLDKLDEDLINEIANRYATMIYLLDNGFLKKDIVDTLASVPVDNIHDTYFAHQVLAKWLELFEKQNLTDSNQPLIKPSSVFKNYTGK